MGNYNSSHTGTEFDNMIANGLLKTEASSTYLTQSNAASTYLSITDAESTYAPLTGTGTSGTWPISISGNAPYATNSTKMYADNSPYRYGDDSPYYMHLTYNTNNDNRWYLRVYPETPKTISVDYAYSAGSATYASSYLANRGTVSGGSHAAALSSYFSSNKASIPRNCLVTHYSSAYGNGSQCMGYWLAGYDSAPYGGFFVCHYNNAKYVGIQNGSYTEYDISKSAASSIRIKENIKILEESEAKKILSLKPIKFDYKKGYGDKEQIGFIAEEVEKIIPNAVYTPNYNPDIEEQPIQSIKHWEFIPYLIKMIQIQQEDINLLKEKIT